jgi:hypothetical protein
MLKDIHHECGIDPGVFMDQDIPKPRHSYHRVQVGASRIPASPKISNASALVVGTRSRRSAITWPALSEHASMAN